MGFGLFKRNALGIAVGTVGAALLARSATNTDFQNLVEEASAAIEELPGGDQPLELEPAAGKQVPSQPRQVH